MIKQINITEKDQNTIRKYLPGLLKGKCPKSRLIKETLSKVICTKRVQAIQKRDQKSVDFLSKLLIVVHPENNNFNN